MTACDTFGLVYFRMVVLITQTMWYLDYLLVIPALPSSLTYRIYRSIYIILRGDYEGCIKCYRSGPKPVGSRPFSDMNCTVLPATHCTVAIKPVTLSRFSLGISQKRPSEPTV